MPSEPDKRAHQVVARSLARQAAELDERAVRGHHFEIGHVVGGEAVLQAVSAARVFRHVATDGAHLLAGRVRSVEEAVRLGRPAHLEVGHARLQHGTPVLRADRQDGAHA